MDINTKVPVVAVVAVLVGAAFALRLRMPKQEQLPQRQTQPTTGDASSYSRTVKTLDGRIYEALLVESPIEVPSAKELMGSESGKFGAIATFEGVTRDSFEGKTVTELEYEAYPSMALNKMIEIMEECARVFEDVRKIVIVHRLGPCPAGETSLFIATLSAHRAPALAALPLLVDTLKLKVPIWKLEKYATDDGLENEVEALWKENAGWDPKSLSE